MKNLLLLLICITSFNVFAQAPCATEMPQEQLDWLRNYKNSPWSSLKVSRANNFYYIPIKVHIVGDDDGNGYYRTRLLLSAFCKLNEQYASVGMYFYMYGDINYFNNSSMYDHSGFSVQTIVNTYNDVNAVNMYFVENPAGACGYFSGFGGKPFIAIRKSCGGIDNSTIAHEIGHYFSLPHTFSGWENRAQSEAARSSDERVDGSNCSFRGDNFCDTPADFISDRWNCPYTGTKLDFTGAPFAPDGSLYMSYANDACQNKFSPEQMDAMVEYLNSNSRRFLLNQPIPDTTIGNFTQLLLPEAEEIVPANYVQLKWNKVFNATHYFVSGTRFSNPNATSFEFITTDTSFLMEDIQPGFRYRWRVKPFNGANMCAPFSDEFAFTAAQPSAILPGVLVSPITCNGDNNGSISLNPIGGNPPYTYFWNNGQTTASINNLSNGNYRGTVYDVDNKEIYVDVDIVNPNPVLIEFTQSGSIVTAVPTGGTPPYTYEWSNSVTGSSISVNAGSYYHVYITDSRGCRSFRDSNGTTSVKENTSVVSALKVFPNPLTGNSTLNVEFNVSSTENVSVIVYDFSGRKVSENVAGNFSGVYKNTVDMSNLPKGVYLVKVAAGVEFITRRITIQ
jgi:hypothetical protein